MVEALSLAARFERALAGVPRRAGEASIKLSGGEIQSGRVAVGVEKRHLPRPRLLGLADALHIPPGYRANVDESYDSSNFYYFGYEEDDRGGNLRLYVEFPVYVAPLTEAEAASSDRSRPWLQAVGYKWSAATGQPLATSRYVWFVHMPRETIVERVRSIGGAAAGPAFSIVEELVLRGTKNPPVYVEVTEPGNPRVSFDVNVYAARLTIGDIRERLTGLAAHYELDPSRFDAAVGAVADRRLGHVSAGVDRRGRDFLTIYYAI